MVISEISKLFAVLAAAYPRFEVDDIKLQLRYEILNDISYSMAHVLNGHKNLIKMPEDSLRAF